MSSTAKNATLKLLAVGMENAAKWQLDGLKLKAVGHKAARWRYLTAAPHMLYAFCSDDDVLYIGKTTKTLSKRFVGFCNAGSGNAIDSRCQREIRKLLGRGTGVHILVLPPDPSLTWNGIGLNLGAGLEDNLIGTFKPKWKTGKQGCFTEGEQMERDQDKTLNIHRRTTRGRAKKKRKGIRD